jgi:hypothetical protein
LLCVGATQHLPELVAVTNPRAIVVAGHPGDAAARWSYQVARARPGLPTFQYDPGSNATLADRRQLLPRLPASAAEEILENGHDAA